MELELPAMVRLGDKVKENKVVPSPLEIMSKALLSTTDFGDLTTGGVVRRTQVRPGESRQHTADG